MGIRPAKPKRVDRGASQPLGRPRHCLERELCLCQHHITQPFILEVSYLYPQKLGINLGIHLLEIRIRRYHPPLQHQNRLDNARDPRRPLKMANIALERAHNKRILQRPHPPERSAQRGTLNGVTHRGARTVGLEIPRGEHAQPGFPIGIPDERLLRHGGRHGDAGGVSVLVAAGGADDSLDGVSVPQSIVEALEDEHAEAFAARVAVGAVVEGEALGGGREHVHGAEGVHHVGGEDEVASGDDGLGICQLRDDTHRKGKIPFPCREQAVP